MLEFIAILLFICLCICSYVIFNLLRKIETYEDAIQEYADVLEIQTGYLQDISTTITEGKRHIDMIDAKGIFQADDEVGTFFDAIKVIQENLNRYAQEVDNAEKKEE